jgi:hypothetical protein
VIIISTKAGGVGLNLIGSRFLNVLQPLVVNFVGTQVPTDSCCWIQVCITEMTTSE